MAYHSSVGMKRPAALGRACEAVCVAGLSFSSLGWEGGGGGSTTEEEEEEEGGLGREGGGGGSTTEEGEEEGAWGVCCARVPTTRVGPSVGTGASVKSLLRLLVWRVSGGERALEGRGVSVAAGT
jgi:hypothetical protein